MPEASITASESPTGHLSQFKKLRAVPPRYCGRAAALLLGFVGACIGHASNCWRGKKATQLRYFRRWRSSTAMILEKNRFLSVAASPLTRVFGI
jgi:hypothetical protein